MRKKHLIPISLVFLLSVVVTAIISSRAVVATPNPFISPASVNTHPECPANVTTIWVRMNDHAEYGELSVNVPFEYGFDNTDVDGAGSQDIASGYVNYVTGVLYGEIHPVTSLNIARWSDESIRAMAVAARTLAYDQCGNVQVGTTHWGIDDSDKQHYRPGYQDAGFSQEDKERYRMIEESTAGRHMVYNGDVFDVRYGATNPLTTDNGWPNPPHKSILDPVGANYTVSRSGMGQVNADHWASGDDPTADDLLHPRWTDYRQILTHYYTQIDIRDAAENDLTPYLRWNALSLDWGTTGNTPPVMYSSESYPLTVIIQNTGEGTWYSNQAQTIYFTYHYHNPRTGITDSSGNWETVATGIAPGVNTTVVISINDVPGWYEPGPYILQLDMIRRTGLPQSLEWFSDQGWPTLNIPVCLNGPCQVFLPIVMKNYSQ